MDKLRGREKIYYTAERITADNVVEAVNKTLQKHLQNAQQEEFLYWYRRGEQRILQRKKTVRPEICNKVVINNANQVVNFKNGYFLTKPACYVARKKGKTKKVGQLNEYIYASGKHEVDNEVVNWFHTVGIGVMYVKPEMDEKRPFKVYSLDPRQAYCVYSYKTGRPMLFAVNCVLVGEKYIFDVFTDEYVFKLEGNTVSENNFELPFNASRLVSVEKNQIGKIPMVEYVYNDTRMGAFENAIPIMEAINLVESNRLDGIEQFIQSLIVTTNVQFDENTTANEIRQAGMINLKSIGDNKADFQVLAEQLDQTQTQVTLDDLYEQLLDKCSMPAITRNESSSSDNGSAVYLKSGYSIADTDARNTADLFIKANREFDEIILTILRKFGLSDLEITDFELKIDQNSMSNLLVKTQAGLNMRELGFAPEIVFARTGISADPETDIALSKEYIEAKWSTKKEEKTVQQDEKMVDGQTEELSEVTID